MSKANSKEVAQRANEAAKRAHKMLSPSALYAIGIAAPNIRKGVFWGFDTMAGAKEHIDAIKADNNIWARPIGNSVIVEVNPDYLIKSVQAVTPDMFTPADIEKMKTNMAEAVAGFQKFLINKGMSSKGGGGTICLYSTNDVMSVTVKGVDYPAFRLNIEKAMYIMGQLGYNVKVDGQFIPASQAVSDPRLTKSLLMTPTKTGVFIDIQSTYSKEVLKNIKKQLSGK